MGCGKHKADNHASKEYHTIMYSCMGGTTCESKIAQHYVVLQYSVQYEDDTCTAETHKGRWLSYLFYFGCYFDVGFIY